MNKRTKESMILESLALNEASASTLRLNDIKNCTSAFIDVVKDLKNKDINDSNIEVNIKGRNRFLVYADGDKYVGRHSSNGRFNPSRDEDGYGTDYKAAARNISARVDDPNFLSMCIKDGNKNFYFYNE